MRGPVRATTTMLALLLFAVACGACGGKAQSGAAGGPQTVTTPPATLPAAGIVLTVPGSGSFTLAPATEAERAQVKLATADEVVAALHITLPMTPTAFLCHVTSSQGYRGWAGRTVWVMCYDRHTPVPWVAGGPPRSNSPEPTHTMYFTKNVFLVDASNARNTLGYMLP